MGMAGSVEVPDGANFKHSAIRLVSAALRLATGVPQCIAEAAERVAQLNPSSALPSPATAASSMS